MTFNEVAEPREEEQRPGKHAAGSESQRVVAACVVTLVCQDSAQCGFIEKRNRPGRNIYPRSEQARAEGSRLRVVDEQGALQGLLSLAAEKSIKASGRLQLSNRAGYGSDNDGRSQCS
ncbi:MAG TPA: hypothetical protein VN880_18400 [Solirubrobacteraceae bacterium]|nr:hypothetical protein [Solirubrobacteraceae bacterium]